MAPCMGISCWVASMMGLSAPSPSPSPSQHLGGDRYSRYESGPDLSEHAIAMPSMLPQVDFHPTAHLTPTKDTTHWYSVKPNPDHDDQTSIRVAMSHSHPVVALDHSMHISNVQCTGNTDMLAEFVTAEAFEHARGVWSPQEDVVVVTAAPSCSDDGQNTFYHVLGMSFDEGRQSVTLKCNWKHIHDVAHSWNIDFGKMTYEPTTVPPPSPTTSCTEEPKSTTTAKPSGTAKPKHKGTVMGFPAVRPGPNFDQRLDNKLGYYSKENISANEVLSKASGISLEDLHKRGLFDFIGTLVSNVKNAVTDFVVNAISAIGTVLSFAAAAVKAVVNVAFAVIQIAATGMYSAMFSIGANLKAPVNSISPFGSPAYNIISYRLSPTDQNITATKAALMKLQGLIGNPTPQPGIDVWCINCFFSSTLAASGTIQATLLQIKTATVSVQGALSGNIGIGANVFAKYTNRIQQDLLVGPLLGGWAIPNVIALGPRFVLSARVDLTAVALGQFYAAYGLTWPSVLASFDFLSLSPTQSGWVPQVTQSVKAAGTVEVTTAFSLPMTLQLQLLVLNKFSASANVSNVPGLAASANVSLDLAGTFPCQGVGLALDFFDNLEVAAGLDGNLQGAKSATIVSYTAPIASTCISVQLPAATKARRYLHGEIPEVAAEATAMPRAIPMESLDVPAPDLVVRQADANQSDDEPMTKSTYPVKPCDIWDQTHQMQMWPNVNGNLFLNANLTGNTTLLNGNNPFMKAHKDGTDIVYGDSWQRVLHYYPDTLHKLGVSRLRLATWQNLPKGSHVITMASVPAGKNSNSTMLVGMDAQGTQAWIYCCAIENEPNKMFLVKDWRNGTEVLESEEMRGIVTGGVASKCLPIAVKT